MPIKAKPPGSGAIGVAGGAVTDRNGCVSFGPSSVSSGVPVSVSPDPTLGATTAVRDDVLWRSLPEQILAVEFPCPKALTHADHPPSCRFFS
jgi:hypothetical protein